MTVLASARKYSAGLCSTLALVLVSSWTFAAEPAPEDHIQPQGGTLVASGKPSSDEGTRGEDVDFTRPPKSKRVPPRMVRIQLPPERLRPKKVSGLDRLNHGMNLSLRRRILETKIMAPRMIRCFGRV